jgi:hypothetical protein
MGGQGLFRGKNWAPVIPGAIEPIYSGKPGFGQPTVRVKPRTFSMQNNSPTQSQVLAKPPLFMPDAPPTAAALRNVDPEILLDQLPLELATQILAEWRASRATEGVPPPVKKTVDLYARNSEMLEHKYSREAQVEVGLLSPVDIVKQLFVHSKLLAQSTWNLYRHGFLHTMNAREQALVEQGLPQPSLVRALAALIVASKKPMADPRSLGAPQVSSRRPRTKSVSAADFEKLINHLATGYSTRNLRPLKAQSFAMAILATGLRPAEWARTTIRPARADEVPHGESPEGWIALEVDTAKRKDDEPGWKRTIVVEPGLYQVHIHQHHDQLHAFLNSNPTAEDPATNYSVRCSRALKKACEELWPEARRGKAPVRVTLYTLRHQARANIAAAYGGFVAAAMMGHSPHTGENWYSGKHRANNLSMLRRVRNAGVPVPVPGMDVLLQAQEFENNPALMESAGHSDEQRDAP